MYADVAHMSMLCAVVAYNALKNSRSEAVIRSRRRMPLDIFIDDRHNH